MSAGLDLTAVSFGYNDLPVLKDFCLTVQPGEAVALLGPNGCGKTTLLRLAAGVRHADEGTVRIDGRRVRGYGRKELARIVATLPQELDVPPGWSVREVVGLGRTPHVSLLGSTTPTDRDSMDRALDLARCADLAEREYGTLSGGQKQRVALAMAVAQEPRLLLLDEPTSHLDLRYRAALLDAIRDLHQDLGLTVLAAMHDPTLAALYFPRLLLMAEGCIVADGPAEDVLTASLLQEVYGVPVHVTSDPALGVPVVNVLPARLQHRTAGTR